MRPIPLSPRASYDELEAHLFESPESQTPRLTVRAETARGRQEIEVWIEVCAELGLPLPSWTPETRAQWEREGHVLFRAADFLDDAAEYENILRMIREEHGDTFTVRFEARKLGSREAE